jgi:hypothetical protein
MAHDPDGGLPRATAQVDAVTASGHHALCLLGVPRDLQGTQASPDKPMKVRATGRC